MASPMLRDRPRGGDAAMPASPSCKWSWSSCATSPSPPIEQQLHAERSERNARHGDELSTARRLIEEMLARPNLDGKGNRLAKAALAEITKVRTSYVTGLRRIDARIAELAEVVPDVKLDARRRKIQARIDRGSTEGERAAARHLLTNRSNREPQRLAPAPEPLPRTRAEMLARRNTRNRN